MPVVTFNAAALRTCIGRDVPTAELAQRMPMLGGDLDRVQGDEITIEWFPNRTDLLVLEGTGRAMRAFLDVKPGLPSYAVAPAKTELRVDSSVAKVRPYAALCFVRNVPVDEAYVKVLVEAQEKLTHSPGRRRRKIAIGLHDARGIQGPFTYTCVPGQEKPFTALGESTPRTPADIVATHPKGKEFGALLPPGKFPVFLDRAGEVLSLPPVINAQRTAITAATRDILVDVTGTDAKSVRATAALLATCLAERGGTIEAVTVHDQSGTWTCPDLRPSEHILHTDDIEATLGLSWSGDHAAQCLRRMGHGAQAFDNKLVVQVAPWRYDILHPVDLIEDAGIGHGFDRFPGDLPTSVTFGAALRHQALEDRLRTVLLGLGWLEAKTLSLSNGRDQTGLWGAPAEPAVQVLNPVIEDQTQLRTRLAPSLLRVLAANRHRNLPQRLFEVGYVVRRDGKGHWRNQLRLACVELSARAGFSDAKGVAEALSRDAGLGLSDAPAAEPGFIPGRHARLMHGGQSVGVYGELHPDPIVAFGLGAPCIVVELDLEPFLAQARDDARR